MHRPPAALFEKYPNGWCITGSMAAQAYAAAHGISTGKHPAPGDVNILVNENLFNSAERLLEKNNRKTKTTPSRRYKPGLANHRALAPRRLNFELHHASKGVFGGFDRPTQNNIQGIYYETPNALLARKREALKTLQDDKHPETQIKRATQQIKFLKELARHFSNPDTPQSMARSAFAAGRTPRRLF